MLTAILLMGPTGAGKTAMAVELVRRFPLEIISVDSAMVYRGLDIGTAKPDTATLALAPHQLIDIREPTERYSVGEFLRDAEVAAEQIRARGRVPLLVGGTMLYFRAWQRGLAQLPNADPALRARLDQRGAVAGWPALHAELAAIDPAAAARIHANDSQRIQRALEVHALTGVPLSQLQQQAARAPRADELRFALAPAERQQLTGLLAERFHRMVERGLVAEVEKLHARGDLTPDLPAIRSVGYRQLWRHVTGQCELEAAIEQGIVATRQLAKRQMTWLRAEEGLIWENGLESSALGHISGIVEQRLDGS